MDLTVLLYVDAVLHARDCLLSANIKVIRYDLYPNGRVLSAYPAMTASEQSPR